MIRLSDDIHKFRKELFNAPELFIKKINNADLLTKKWKMISRNLIICNMEDTKNPATNYFENALKVLSKKRQLEIGKFLINSNNFDENYKFHENEDPYDLYNYFLCIVCGTKIKNAEISLKDKFSFKKLNGFINGKSDKIKSIFQNINNNQLIYLLGYLKDIDMNNLPIKKILTSSESLFCCFSF